MLAVSSSLPCSKPNIITAHIFFQSQILPSSTVVIAPPVTHGSFLSSPRRTPTYLDFPLPILSSHNTSCRYSCPRRLLLGLICQSIHHKANKQRLRAGPWCSPTSNFIHSSPPPRSQTSMNIYARTGNQTLLMPSGTNFYPLNAVKCKRLWACMQISSTGTFMCNMLRGRWRRFSVSDFEKASSPPLSSGDISCAFLRST